MTAPVTQAAEWLRAISTWLLETDNDMKLPNGILDVDPLDIADALDDAEAAAKAREDALVEALESFAAHVPACREAFPDDPVSSGQVCRDAVSFADFERAAATLAAHRAGGDA